MTRKSADLMQVIDLASAYWTSRAVLSAQELGLFAALAEKPATTQELAARVGCSERGTGLLANALVGLGLLEKREGRFANGPFAQEHLVPGRGDYLGGYLEHHLDLWRRWSELTPAVRTGAGVHLDRPPGGLRSFIMAMHTMSEYRARGLVDHLDLTGVRRLIDVGGGSGDNAYECLRRLPEATAVIFDLPDVAPITEECAALAGMVDRVEMRLGDYWKDELGEGFDLAIVSQILHSADRDGCVLILEKAYRALVPGGRCVVHDFVLTDDGTEPQWASLFSLNMLTGGSPGRSYTGAEIREMLEAAGFVDLEHVPMEGDTDLVIGRRPS